MNPEPSTEPFGRYGWTFRTGSGNCRHSERGSMVQAFGIRVSAVSSKPLTLNFVTVGSILHFQAHINSIRT